MSRESRIVRGSPATLLYNEDGVVYIVDPGHGRKRAKQLAKEVAGLGASTALVLVTHYHSDHHAALSEGLIERLESGGVSVKVAAPAADAPLIRDPALRVLATFGYPIGPGDPLLPFKAPASRVDEELGPPTRLGPLEVIPLPGHTPGQVGVLSPDGVLYAADAIFGEAVLKRYGTPYHLDPCRALESLDRLAEALAGADALQPSHGPLLRGPEAEGLIDLNRSALEALLRSVEEALAGGPLGASEAAARVASRLGAVGEPGMLMLVETTVRGALACLYRRGSVEPVAAAGGLAWRASRR